MNLRLGRGNVTMAAAMGRWWCGGLLLACLLGGLAAGAAEPPPLRLAVLTRPGAPATLMGAADLLRVRLQQEKVILLERQALDKILQEQALTRFFDTPLAAAGFEGADVLLLLDWVAAKPQSGIRLRLIQSTSGIRWLDTVCVCDPRKLEQAAEALANAAMPRLRAPRDQVPFYVAVLPFRNRTATLQFDARLPELARSLELQLAQQPRVMLLERSDAEALRTETSLTKLPNNVREATWMVEGEITRQAAVADDTGLIFTLKGQRLNAGNDTAVAATRPLTRLLAGEAGACFAEFISRLTGQSAVPPAKTESPTEGERQVAEAKDLLALGFAEDAVRCFDAALLLGCDRPEVRHARVEALQAASVAVSKRLPRVPPDASEWPPEQVLAQPVPEEAQALLAYQIRLVDAVAENWNRAIPGRPAGLGTNDWMSHLGVVVCENPASAFVLLRYGALRNKRLSGQLRDASDYGRFLPGEVGARERFLAESVRGLLLRMWDVPDASAHMRRELESLLTAPGAMYLFADAAAEDQFRLKALPRWLREPTPTGETVYNGLRLADTRLCTVVYEQLFLCKNPCVDLWVNYTRWRQTTPALAAQPFADRCAAAWPAVAALPYFPQLANNIGYGQLTEMRCAAALTRFITDDQRAAADAWAAGLLDLPPYVLMKGAQPHMRLVADYYAASNPARALEFVNACLARGAQPATGGDASITSVARTRADLELLAQELRAKCPGAATAATGPVLTRRLVTSMREIGRSRIYPDLSAGGRRVLFTERKAAAVTTDGKTFISLGTDPLPAAAACGRECVWLLGDRQLRRVDWTGKTLETISVPDWFGQPYNFAALAADAAGTYVVVAVDAQRDPASVIARLDRKTGQWTVLLEARTPSNVGKPLEGKISPWWFLRAPPPNLYLRLFPETYLLIDTAKWTVSHLPREQRRYQDLGLLAYELAPDALRKDRRLPTSGVDAVLQLGADILAVGRPTLLLPGGTEGTPVPVTGGDGLWDVQPTAYGLWGVGLENATPSVFELSLSTQNGSRKP